MNAFAQALSAALDYAVVSRLLDDGAPVGFLYREAPAFEHDSGWRFFRGDESDEFCDNPDNFATVPLQDVLREYPDTAALMGEAAGAWEWCEDTQGFVAAADWQPQD
nr:DUF2185 domain-containing protein [Conchiformibius kuhniae]